MAIKERLDYVELKLVMLVPPRLAFEFDARFDEFAENVAKEIPQFKVAHTRTIMTEQHAKKRASYLKLLEHKRVD